VQGNYIAFNALNGVGVSGTGNAVLGNQIPEHSRHQPLARRASPTTPAMVTGTNNRKLSGADLCKHVQHLGKYRWLLNSTATSQFRMSSSAIRPGPNRQR
jgi:hypothetical protein